MQVNLLKTICRCIVAVSFFCAFLAINAGILQVSCSGSKLAYNLRMLIAKHICVGDGNVAEVLGVCFAVIVIRFSSAKHISNLFHCKDARVNVRVKALCNTWPVFLDGFLTFLLCTLEDEQCTSALCTSVIFGRRCCSNCFAKSGFSTAILYNLSICSLPRETAFPMFSKGPLRLDVSTADIEGTCQSSTGGMHCKSWGRPCKKG